MNKIKKLIITLLFLLIINVLLTVIDFNFFAQEGDYFFGLGTAIYQMLIIYGPLLGIVILIYFYSRRGESQIRDLGRLSIYFLILFLLLKVPEMMDGDFIRTMRVKQIVGGVLPIPIVFYLDRFLDKKTITIG